MILSLMENNDVIWIHKSIRKKTNLGPYKSNAIENIALSWTMESYFTQTKKEKKQISGTGCRTLYRSFLIRFNLRKVSCNQHFFVFSKL